MISPIDLISQVEINAKRMIKKGDLVGAKKMLLSALESVESGDFLEAELPDLVIILKKISSDFTDVGDFDGAFRSLFLIYRKGRGKFNIYNEIKNYLNNLPENFDVSKYDKEIREMVKNQWEIIELLNLIENNYRKNRSN